MLGSHDVNLYSSKHGLPYHPPKVPSKPKSIHFGTHFGGGSSYTPKYKYDPTVSFTEIGGPSTPKSSYHHSVSPNSIPESNRYNGYGGSNGGHHSGFTVDYVVPKVNYKTTPIPVYMLTPKYTSAGTVRPPAPVYEPTKPPYVAPVYKPPTTTEYVPKFYSSSTQGNK